MINLDEATLKRLRSLQRTNKDRRVFIKVTVLLMLHMQFSAQDISASLGIDDDTVYRYRQAFENEGLETYLKSSFVAYSGKLNEDQELQLTKAICISIAGRLSIILNILLVSNTDIRQQ